MFDIRIGSYVPAVHAHTMIPQLNPLGYESYALNFNRVAPEILPHIGEHARAIVDVLDGRTISAIGYYGNPLTDLEFRENLIRMIKSAHLYGCSLIGTFAGGLPGQPVPDAIPLVGMLMLGNLFKESGLTNRLSDTAQNAMCNIVTIMLGMAVGASAKAETFLTLKTIEIIILGVIAFGGGTAGGVLLAKFMNLFLPEGKKINPLIGSAGVSAVPMAARVSNTEGQKAKPGNFLLMNAMGPNVAGVIGSAIAAGVLISLFA